MRTELMTPTAEDAAIAWRLFEGRAAASYEDADMADANAMRRMARDRVRFDLARPRERILLDLP